MLSHLSLSVVDLPRAMAFWDAAVSPLGYTRVWTVETAAGYGVPDGNDRLALKLFPQPPDPGPGFHIALRAPTRESVAAFHAAGVEHGGTDHGPPGLRPQYGPGYFAAFVIDPDGHRVEAVCHGVLPGDPD